MPKKPMPTFQESFHEMFAKWTSPGWVGIGLFLVVALVGSFFRQ